MHNMNAAATVDTIPHSQSFSCDPDNSSIPSILMNKKSMKPTVKPTNLDFEMTRRTSQQNPCDCYYQNITIDENGVNEEDEEQNDVEHNSNLCMLCCHYIWSPFVAFQKYTSKFVASKYFCRLILSAVVINTVSMGIEYHGQPQSLTNALEYSNLVFTLLFAIEMVLKIIGDGCLTYIKNVYNLFDGVIAIMSVIELQGNKNSGLSVLRTFRLLRVLKLVRFMPTLRRQLVRTIFEIYL